MSAKMWVVDLSDVDLSDEEGGRVDALLRKGQASARQLTRARIPLMAADDWPDEQWQLCCIAAGRPSNVHGGASSGRGLEAALSERPRPGAAPALDHKATATLLALACANPPEGRTCWTMQLLADEPGERLVVGGISDETVRRTLKKRVGA